MKEQREKVEQLMEIVGLHPEQINRYPHEFSGGQRQRISVARALALNPKLVIADEPVSALDVSIQAQVLNLFIELQSRFNLTYLFISHDLRVVRHVADRVAVMYLGSIIELATSRSLYRTPLHPYTEALISAVPVPNPRAKKERILLEGDVPSPIAIPAGCCFFPRCRYGREICSNATPEIQLIGENHWVACHFPRHQ